MAISEKKLAANRANAQRSTGPRTAEGKAAVARNLLAHALVARSGGLLPKDDERAFMRFAVSMLDELRPAGPMQDELAGDVVLLSWKLRLAAEAETMLLIESHGLWKQGR